MKTWRSLVPSSQINLYNQIDDMVAKAREVVPTKNLSDQELKVVAKVLLKLKNEQRKIVYRHDFKAFTDDMFPDLQDKLPTPDFHLEMYTAYQTQKRVAVVCPRGHAKSTTARVFILHQVLNGLTDYCVLIGSSQDIAAQNMRWVKEQIEENSHIREVYGYVKGEKKWSDTDFITSTGIKLSARGAGQKLRGVNEKGRPDLIYIDDLEDDDMVESKDMRDKVSRWFRKAVLPAKSKNGRIIYTGTILNMDSLLKNVSLNKVRDHIAWHVLFYQAIITDANGIQRALWEDMKPLEDLKMLQSSDPETFSQEYMNDPRASGQAVFRQEWYSHHANEAIELKPSGVFFLGQQLTVMITTDFAISEKSGADYSVVMATGMGADGILRVLEYKRFRTADPDEIFSEAINMARFWKGFIIWGEEVVFSVVLYRMIEKLIDSSGLDIIVDMIKRTQAKLPRIKVLASPIKRGKITWAEDMTELEEELKQVVQTKLGRYDDILDCLADAWNQQLEHIETKREEETPVNTFEWAVENGMLPTASEEQLMDLTYEYVL